MLKENHLNSGAATSLKLPFSFPIKSSSSRPVLQSTKPEIRKDGWRLRMELVSISLLTLAENCRRLWAKNNRQHDRMPPIYPVAIHHPNCELFIQCGPHNKQKGNPCYYKAHGRWNIWEARLTTSVKYMIKNWGQRFRLHF